MSRYRFSVVIPTYERPEQLARCLGAVRSQDFPMDSVEIVVVDDGSRIPVRERVEGVGGIGVPAGIRWMRIPNSGPGAARNRGSKEARGEYLAFIDDDCIPCADWLANVDRCATRFPDALIGGRTLNRRTDDSHSTTSQIIVDAVYRHYNADALSARFLASNNMAVRAERFARVGGFDEAFRIASEDRELCDRWLSRRGRIVLCEKIVIYHDHRLGLASFCRQHFNYGRGAHQYHSLRHHRGSGSIKTDLRFHAKLGTLLGPALGKLKPTMAAKVCVLLVVWQVANLFGFLSQRSRSRKAEAVP